MTAPHGGVASAVFCLLAAACVGLLAREGLQPDPGPELVLRPVAPPLTRIASLGDTPLLPEPEGGSRPSDRAGALAPGPPGPPPPPPEPANADPGHILRLQVEADAIALVELLGPERVDAAVVHREALSALLGESRTWEDLLASLEARAAEEPQ